MKRANIFKNKRILITGGTGSFGKLCAKILLDEYSPKKVIIFSRDEFKQFNMKKEFSRYKNIRFFLGDVRDERRLRRAFDSIDIVIHAAALKQVPAAEYNPFEFVKTNILGAQNIIEAAIDKGVSKVLALSTDKAAAPINLYGATKLTSDKLFIAGNVYAKRQKTIFSVVRYGNVLGSRGSVIPYFLELKKQKKQILPITHPDMTRFWITKEQAVRFSLMCIDQMAGGELFVPKIPSMKIINLAKWIMPNAKLKQIGIRPGEKLHEVLITEELARATVEFKDYYVVMPEFHEWNKNFKLKGKYKKVEENFEYNSLNNDKWITEKDFKDYLKKLEI